MAKYSLNIYGENDEIIKTYETNFVRWKMFMDAVKLNEGLGKMSTEKQFKVVNDFVKGIFPGLTDEDLEKAAADDIFNTFRAIVMQANGIGGVKGAGEPSPNDKAVQQ